MLKKVIKKCPACGSSRIVGLVVTESGIILNKTICKKCGYKNILENGAKKPQETDRLREKHRLELFFI